MELNEAITLIEPAFSQNGTEVKTGDKASGRNTQADLGCGQGLFSLALASLLPPESTVYAVDKVLPIPGLAGDFNKVVIRELELDFEKNRLELRELDGILMANSLHYIEDKTALLGRLISCMKPEGRFLVVEYDTAVSNRWVPFPIGFSRLQQLFKERGFMTTKKIAMEKASLFNRANFIAGAGRKIDFPPPAVIFLLKKAGFTFFKKIF